VAPPLPARAPSAPALRKALRRSLHLIRRPNQIYSSLTNFVTSSGSWRRRRRRCGRRYRGGGTAERESSLSTTYWSESTLSSRWFGGPASRHGSLNSLFQVALHLPSWQLEAKTEEVWAAVSRGRYRNFVFGKRNGSRTCLAQTFGLAGTNLGRDGLR